MKNEMYITKLLQNYSGSWFKRVWKSWFNWWLLTQSKATCVRKHNVLSSTWHTPLTSVASRDWCWSVWKEFYLDSRDRWPVAGMSVVWGSWPMSPH